MLLTRLYIWSILLDPLLFFLLTERTITGFSLSFSRILQFIVIFFLIVLFLYRLSRGYTKVSFYNIDSSFFFIKLHYLLLIIFGITGFLFGYYELSGIKHNIASIPDMINSKFARPFFEYFIQAFQIIYFIIMPVYLLKTKEHIDYFFSRFKFIFLIFIALGFADVLAIVMFDFDPLPRHILGWKNVGLRFHGIAGEPRQAYSFIILGLALLHLRAYYYKEKVSVGLLLLSVIAIYLTHSMTAIMGVVFFIIMYILFAISSNIKKIKKILTIALSILFIFLSITYVDRVSSYVEYLLDVWFVLERKDELPYLMKVQATSLYPLYEITVKIREFDLFPVLFGHGLGSSSIINNLYLERGVYVLKNPNAQIVRILYEYGLLGLYVLFLAFYYPIRKYIDNINQKEREGFIIVFLLLLSAYFSIRSQVVFLYVGIFIATFRYKFNIPNVKFQQKNN